MTSATGKPNQTIAKLAERQMRNWEIARTQKKTSETQIHAGVEDFVSISRDVGADANQIGFMLAERLGWPVFDKEILRAMAGDDTTRERIYASMDERDIGWCEESLRALMQPEFVKNDYFRQLTKTLLALARQGNAVFVGRGADLILPRETGLRIRIATPLATRIQGAAEARNLSKEAALKEILQIEEERAGYFRQHFNVDVNDSGRFDIVINLTRTTPDQAVDLILSARKILGLSTRCKSRTSAQRPNNSEFRPSGTLTR